MKSVNDDVGTIPSDGVTDLAATKALYSSTTTLYCLTAVSISIFRSHNSVPPSVNLRQPLLGVYIGQSLENLKDLNRQGLTVFGTYPCNPQ